jgi:NADPH:quinone reductase-like Zn-dependent oxidoreductase
MRAVVCTRYGPPEVLQLQEVARPTPRNNEVSIRILATSVTASDCIVRAFRVHGLMRIPMGVVLGFGKPRKPILGLVLAGEVESTGKHAKRFPAGSEVWAFTSFRFGAYAEHTCLPEKALIGLKPANLTYEEAAAIPYGGLLAMHFLRKAEVQVGQRVLVYGASGAIGTAAVQLARHLGAEVDAVCGPTNMALMKSLGAATVIDYTTEDFTKRGSLYDLVFNAVGKRKAQLQPEGALKPGGRHVTVDDGSPRLRVEDLTLLKELVETGKMRPVIDRSYPLEEMVEAHRYVDQGHKKGNVMIAVAAQG